MAAAVDEIIAFSLYPLCPFVFGFVLISNSLGPSELAHLERYAISRSRHYEGTLAETTKGTQARRVFVSLSLFVIYPQMEEQLRQYHARACSMTYLPAFEM